MGLHKGNTNNPNGRPIGAKNKFTVEVKERIIDILDNNFTIDSINEDLKQLESKDRLHFLLKLLDYTTPKMKQTEHLLNEVAQPTPLTPEIAKAISKRLDENI